MARIGESDFTRLEIIQVATRMFLEKGYTNTTTKAISDELEMSKGNLTFRYPTKEHLLAVHTADDGSEHDLEYVEETESTRIEHGYTEGLYCSECDEYTWGHEEREISDWHWDWDDNGICDD